MNYYSVLIVLIISSFQVLGSENPRSCSLRGSNGGYCVKKGATTYIEDRVYNLDTVILWDEFKALIDRFHRDTQDASSYYATENFKVAGFSFIPVYETFPMESSDPEWRDNRLKFYTKGLRVVLTLWKGTRFEGRVQPSEIAFYGFDSLSHAMTVVAKVADRMRPGPNPYFEKLKTTNAANLISSEDSRVRETREFDLVFIDTLTLRDLATSTRFYKDNIRRDSAIQIERSYIAMRPASDSSVFNYRSLVFKPYPIPYHHTGYESEAAVALHFGRACPPYWPPPIPPPTTNISMEQATMIWIASSSIPIEKNLSKTTIEPLTPSEMIKRLFNEYKLLAVLILILLAVGVYFTVKNGIPIVVNMYNYIFKQSKN